MTMSDSDSPLSSPPSSEDERPVKINLKAKRPKKAALVQTKIKLKAPVRSPSPQPKKRKKEPPHEFTLADSPELAFLVMFRSRFTDAFKGVPNVGPQDLERGVVDSTPSEQVELLLCRLISLVLNRKKPVERGHHTRALEEVLTAQKQQWPRQWEGRNPLPGTRTFNDLDAGGRLVLLKALANWALTSSEQIRTIIAENYKGSRREDDLNVAISVQPWGRDGDKRRYWLVEGRDDTSFRLYRESNPALKNIQWISIAGSIEELKAVADELEEYDGTKHALQLRDRILGAIPRFEDGELRRKKREYRASRKSFFNQTSGVSLYEGRTRGKRIKYTFSDDEGAKESLSADDTGSRRSARSRRSTPAEDQPRFTASGRQIRKPKVGAYGESKTDGTGLPADTTAYTDNGVVENSAILAQPARNYLDDDEDEANDSGADEEDDWDAASSGKEEENSETDESMFSETTGEKKSLRIILKVKGKGQLNSLGNEQVPKPAEDITMLDIGPLEKKVETTAAEPVTANGT